MIKEKNKNLYEICNEIDQLENWLYEQAEHNLGVMPEEGLKYLDSLQGEKDLKLENIYKLLINKKAQIAMYKAEEKRLASIRKALEDSEDFFTNLVSLAIGVGNNFKSGIASFGWRSSKSVEILDEALVPDTFASYSRTISKSAIKQMIESGIEVEGARLITNNNLQVK